MRKSTFAATAAALVGTVFLTTALSAEPSARRVSGPHTHDNIAVYLIHGQSAPGPVPLTLDEALARKAVTVFETSSVNELSVENTGTEDVLIHAGDIVKGGRQDRVLTVSFILAPGSGRVPVSSFCVEAGRWAARGREDVARFSSAAEMLPSREAKIAMMEPPVKTASAAQPAAEPNIAPESPNLIRQRMAAPRDDTSMRQKKMWDEVANTQNKLRSALGGAVEAPQSASSLQLTLENERVVSARKAYVAALEGLPQTADDVVGFAFAINGRISSADVYPSNAVFKKLWPKLLAASVTEALASKGGGDAAPKTPAVADVETFLTAAESGVSTRAVVGKIAEREVRRDAKALYVEGRRTDGAWVHRNYLAF